MTDTATQNSEARSLIMVVPNKLSSPWRSAVQSGGQIVGGRG
jgi:hypothetical protein